MSKALPEVPLAEIAKPISRNVEVIPGQSYRTIGVKWWGEGAYERQTIDGSGTAAKTLSLVRQGDLIINKIWVRHGSTAIAGADVDGCVASGEFPTFTLDKTRVEPRWLHWQTKTRGFWTKCDALSQGTSGKNRIKPELFMTIRVPLPPLAEQRRVVARIEELAAQIHEARTLREQATEEAEALSYASLRQKRHRLLNSSHPKSPLGSLTKVTSGGTPSRENGAFWNGDIPWIKTGELLDGDISRADEHITDAGVENSSAKLFPSETILIALYGQGQTRGRTGRLLIPATTNQACCAVLPKPDRFESRFIQFWLRSLYVELREEAQGGAQPNWNGAMIKDLEIALPPLAEQRRIVAELDALQTEVDAMKRLQAETAAELDALLPAILDRAFKGEL
jgi:type I restriction enzyme, S subunit